MDDKKLKSMEILDLSLKSSEQKFTIYLFLTVWDNSVIAYREKLHI